MTLLLFMAPVGYKPIAWRDPQSRIEDIYGLELPRDIALRAEEAKFHAVFLADWLSFGAYGPISLNPDQTGYEPLTTAGALAASTSKIGIIATASTTFMEPFNAARYFSQLDWLSNGRIGWNIVTSTTGQENFQVPLPPRDERYMRAAEYLQVAKGLWDCWPDDAVIADRSAAVWADADRVRPLNHRGTYYQVEGPLLVPRSPQGWPVLAQAGASDAGKDFAASHAEVVFTVTRSLELGQDFYADLKSRTVAAGRSESSIQILPGIMPIVGSTEAEAQRLSRELSDYVPFSESIVHLSRYLGGDLSHLSPEDIISADEVTDPARITDSSTRSFHIYDLAINKRWRVRDLVREVNRSDGHSALAGTPTQIADHLEHWFTNRAADGFVILPPTVPTGTDGFFDEVVPVLQNRGLFRREYVDGTLRDNLNLSRPPSRSPWSIRQPDRERQ